jgi:hypothetical protein
MFAKSLSNRTLGIVSLLCFSAFFILLVPYYYILGRQAYITKTNPDLGYFLPNSPEAWTFLGAALFFLTLAIVTMSFFIRRGGLVRSKHKRRARDVKDRQDRDSNLKSAQK